MTKKHLLASAAYVEDLSPGGIVATAMRHLAHATLTATGSTLISPDGTMRYISRAEAERFTFGPKSKEGLN